MDEPKMRNEFGLDRENELDVQKEQAKPFIPWAASSRQVIQSC